VPETIIAPNGTLVRLAPGRAEIIDHVHSGRLALDGTQLIKLDPHALKTRRQIVFNGAATVTLVADRAGKLLTEPRVSVQGFDASDEVNAACQDAVAAIMLAFKGQLRGEENGIRQETAILARRAFKQRLGKKPLTDVQIVRI
jgi:ribonuclease J